jgi:hypothetical protein
VLLDLSFVPGVTDAVLTQLTRVRVLRIEGCLEVTMLSDSMLAHVRELNVEGCANLYPRAEISHIPRLRAKGCGAAAAAARSRDGRSP